jgi:hypothetical protein
MCIIIHRPKDVEGGIDLDTVKRCAGEHPDGMGFMYAERGLLHSAKVLADPTEFWGLIEPIVARRVPLALHFRTATHGTKDLHNVHPFPVNESLYLMHNGILRIAMDKHEARSDTRVFAEDWLRTLPKKWWRNPVIMEFLRDYIGRGNKLLLLHSAGEAFIVNRSAGVDENGMWYSNESFRPRAYSAYQGTRHYPVKGDTYDSYPYADWSSDYKHSPAPAGSPVAAPGTGYIDQNVLWNERAEAARKRREAEMKERMELARTDREGTSVVPSQAPAPSASAGAHLPDPHDATDGEDGGDALYGDLLDDDTPPAMYIIDETRVCHECMEMLADPTTSFIAYDATAVKASQECEVCERFIADVYCDAFGDDCNEWFLDDRDDDATVEPWNDASQADAEQRAAAELDPVDYLPDTMLAPLSLVEFVRQRDGDAAADEVRRFIDDSRGVRA